MELKCVLVFVALLAQEIGPLAAAIRGTSGKKPTSKQQSNNLEATAEYWNNVAQNILQKAKSKRPIKNLAKNVIFFLGDGMSVPTVTAARIHVGGESNELSFEKFPYTAVSKTYCVDRLVAESTATATAYLGGVKGNFFTSGLTAAVKLGDCDASLLPENQVDSIAAWSQKEDKWTGFVTTTRITHASPAGLYSHTAHKNWESDTDVSNSNKDPKHCPDIARQLVESEVGQNFRVILGCGRKKFIPKNMKDEEGSPGQRSDNRNLIEEWQNIKNKSNEKYEYVWNRQQLLNLRNETDYLLGMFEDDLCKYNMNRDPKMDPTLEEMTEAAINILKKNKKGYFLFVEGGMIDQAHHLNKAGLALDETAEFSKAIAKAVKITDEEDTLIVVTADHAHTMNIGGYPKRGENILGLTNFSDVMSIDRVIPIISYANGPGFRKDISSHDYTADKIDMNYEYPIIFKLPLETHGGEDVLIYARGPWAHLFHGVMEQNAIPHIMAYASCVGDKSTACKDGDISTESSATSFFNQYNSIFYKYLLSLVIVHIRCKNVF